MWVYHWNEYNETNTTSNLYVFFGFGKIMITRVNKIKKEIKNEEKNRARRSICCGQNVLSLGLHLHKTTTAMSTKLKYTKKEIDNTEFIIFLLSVALCWWERRAKQRQRKEHKLSHCFVFTLPCCWRELFSIFFRQQKKKKFKIRRNKHLILINFLLFSFRSEAHFQRRTCVCDVK